MLIVQRPTTGRALAERLGLDPDQPVIEWHRWGADPGTPADSVVLPCTGVVGSTLELVESVSAVGTGAVWNDNDPATGVSYSAGNARSPFTGSPLIPDDGWTLEAVLDTTYTPGPALGSSTGLSLWAAGYGTVFTMAGAPAPYTAGGRLHLPLVKVPEISQTTATAHLRNGSATVIMGSLSPGMVREVSLHVTWGTGTAASTGWVRDDERTAALLNYTATHGRTGPAGAVAPLGCTARLARALLTGPLPAAGERFRITISEALAAALDVPEAERPRFTGEITDAAVQLGDDRAGDLTTIDVVGVGRSSRLDRLPVTTSRPAELDGKRVRRLLYQARVRLPLELGTLDPGTVQLLPQDYTATTAGAGIAAVAADSLGQLVEHRSGRLDWHDAEHRRGKASKVTLTGAAHTIKPFRWSQAVGTVVNDARVTYGTDRKTVRVTDHASAHPATGLGPYGAEFDTQLAEALDAFAFASTLVGRYGRPAWMLPAVTVDVVRTAGAEAGPVLTLSHGDRITATGLPPDGAFTAGDLFVEGTTEVCTPTAWQLSLAVADPTLAGVGLRWVDVDPALRWVDVDPTLRWLDTATLEDTAGLGVPAPATVDGGTATATPTATVDGGTATATPTATIDGGTA